MNRRGVGGGYAVEKNDENRSDYNGKRCILYRYTYGVRIRSHRWQSTGSAGNTNTECEHAKAYERVERRGEPRRKAQTRRQRREKSTPNR